MKHETTYRDIIEEKIQEWREKVNILKKENEMLQGDIRSDHKRKLIKLRSAIDTASMQLHELDRSENRENTLAVKKDILKIFDRMDRNFIVTEKKVPFML